jgi:hypothetical protein
LPTLSRPSISTMRLVGHPIDDEIQDEVQTPS